MDCILAMSSIFLLAISTTVMHFAHSAAAADLADLVTELPGQPPVSFKHYAGHVVVDTILQKALFYWFFEADNPRQASLPLVLWLNGGPGCSSVFGALTEIGPFRVRDDGMGLKLNANSWSKVANIIFLESPAGVGFSYANSTEAVLSGLNDQTVAKDTLTFLQSWFEKFPEYRQNEFYVAGESYAGHYIPLLVMKIFQSNQAAQSYHINLQGFAIGNAWTDQYYDILGALAFFLSRTIISEESYEDLLKNCDFHKQDLYAWNLEGPCADSRQRALPDFERLNLYNIYSPYCGTLNSSSKNGISLKMRYLIDLRAQGDPCLDVTSPYLNRLDVQEALHVTTPTIWSHCSDQIKEQYNSSDKGTSMLPIYKLLLQEAPRIWIYSGDCDSSVPTIGTKYWLKQLNLTVEVPWYSWNYSTQIGGWAQQYKGLTFATIRGSGHKVPIDRPEESLFIFKHFLAGELLPRFKS